MCVSETGANLLEYDVVGAEGRAAPHFPGSRKGLDTVLGMHGLCFSKSILLSYIVYT